MDSLRNRLKNYYGLLILIVCICGVFCKPHLNRKIRNENEMNVDGQIVNILPRRDYCAYENKTYEAGARFRPDPCTHCHCPRHGGRTQCFIEDCRHLANCIRYTKRTDKCCGTCERIGCEHTNGRSYRPLEVVKLGSCEICKCPLTGGKLQCEKAKCPPAACVDPVKEEGECCEKCPNGPNCWLGNLIIPAVPGRRYPVDRCKVCKCPEAPIPYWMRGLALQAVCGTIC